MKRLLLTLLKAAGSLAILGYLAVQVVRNDVFGNLLAQPKRWELLAPAAALFLAAVVISFVRWQRLVRALDVPLRMGEAFRLGFLGYLFNLAPLGIVGGDLLKAYLLARRRHGQRAESVAAVFMDRAVGLYVLFLMAAAAIAATRLWEAPDPHVRLVAKVALWIAAAATAGVAVVLGPDLSRGATMRWMERISQVGPPLVRLIEAVRLYRFKLPALALATLATLLLQTMMVLGIYLTALALYPQVHDLPTQFVVTPLAESSGAMPFLGAFEATLNLLYDCFPLPGQATKASVAGQGLVVALTYRLITVVIAAVGMIYYLGSRSEVAEALHDQAAAPVSETVA